MKTTVKISLHRSAEITNFKVLHSFYCCVVSIFFYANNQATSTNQKRDSTPNIKFGFHGNRIFCIVTA